MNNNPVLSGPLDKDTREDHEKVCSSSSILDQYLNPYVPQVTGCLDFPMPTNLRKADETVNDSFNSVKLTSEPFVLGGLTGGRPYRPYGNAGNRNSSEFNRPISVYPKTNVNIPAPSAGILAFVLG